jgi:hypothetical protein
MKLMTDDGSICLTDVRRGLIDAVLMCRSAIANIDHPYRQPPPHHTRKLRDMKARAQPLRDLEARLMAKIEDYRP